MGSTRSARSALVLIDLQWGLFEGASPDSLLRERERAVIENSHRLTEAARGSGLLVKVARPSLFGTPMVPGDPLAIGSPQAEFVDGIGPHGADLVVEKLRVSAFYETRLDGLLRAGGIRQIIVGGVFTNVGVESTVRNGWDRFYEVTVVEDACATPKREAHEAAIALSLPRFATVASTADVPASLGRTTFA